MVPIYNCSGFLGTIIPEVEPEPMIWVQWAVQMLSEETSKGVTKGA